MIRLKSCQITVYGLLFVSRKSLIVNIWLVLSKPGGLDSWDQSRLRTSLVSRPTFLKCPDFLDCGDQLFFFSVKIFVEIVKICREAVEIWRQIWLCRGLLSLKMMKSLDGLRNLDEKIQKSTHFLIEIETNCRETPKFSDLDEFLHLDRDFLVWTLMSRWNRVVSISIEISWSSRLTFLSVEIFSTCWDKVLEILRSRVLIKTTERQIETPRLSVITLSPPQKDHIKRLPPISHLFKIWYLQL